jgi:hypothetical protein
MKNKTFLFSALAASLSLALAQQSTTTAVRLVYGDAKTGQLNVMNALDGKSMASFSTPGAVTYVAASGSRQYILAAHRDANRVSVLHSGLSLEDHGDHQDLKESAPHVLATMNVGKKPTHYFVHDKTIAFFNDGDGTVAILDEDKLGLSLEFEQIKAAQPDHGGVVVFKDRVLVGYLALGRVEVFNRASGRVLQTFAGCPSLHGEATQGNTTYWGCGDGVLVVQRNGVTFSAKKIANPAGTPANTRVGTFAENAKLGFAVGNFGTGLAFATPNQASLETMALPESIVKMEFADSGALVVLTRDGALHTIDVQKRAVVASLPLTPAVTNSGEGSVRPSFTLVQNKAFVTNPTKGEILEVNLEGLKLERTLAVGGTPHSIAAAVAEGVKH